MSKRPANDKFYQSPDAEEYADDDEDMDYADYQAAPPPPAARRAAPPAASTRYAPSGTGGPRRGAAPPPAAAPRRPGNTPPARGTRVAPQRGRQVARRGPPSRWTSGPYLFLAFLGTVALGLLGLIVITLVQRNSTGTTTLPAAVPPAAAGTAAPASSADPPRMPLAEFKNLYDNPATRPVIIDVRDAATYAAGHIPGAINVPEANADALQGQVPKDKLVIAYCQ